MNNLLLFMSLTGTSVFLIYGIIVFFFDSLITARSKYTLLKVVLFFYIFPLSYFRYIPKGILMSIFPDYFAYKDRYLLDLTNSITINPDGTFYSLRVRYMMIVILVCLSVSILFSIRKIFVYLKVKSFISYQLKLPNPSVLKEFEETKFDLFFRKKINLRISDYIKSPLSFGLFSPTIVLPDETFIPGGYKNLSYIYLHEFAHIRHHDLAIRFISLMILTFHWFNPFVYVLYYEVCRVSEEYCDEEVILNQPYERIKEYAFMLINMAATKINDDIMLCSTCLIGSKKSNMERRILKIKNQTSFKGVSRYIPILACIFMLFSGATTAFAYQSPLRSYEIDSTVISDCDYVEIVYDNDVTDASLPYDDYLVYKNGYLVEFKAEYSNSQSKAACEHSVETAQRNVHKKKFNGGCEINQYDIATCCICNYISSKKISNTITFKKCIHSVSQWKGFE